MSDEELKAAYQKYNSNMQELIYVIDIKTGKRIY